ncbi:MAG: amino acid ABC transporter substrate-binding protein [Leptolyngbyaceae cyanobacterium SM1_3_5]|nr:amino acid ABC transporter substrate-binding protein [Leptolyngbyaceae cyanobacterium SM1_3_5]
MLRKFLYLLLALSIALGTVTACSGSDTGATGGGGEQTAQAESRLDTIKSRGTLICGVEGTIPGFSFVDPSSTYSGLDVDVCRAVASAIFDTSENIDSKIEYRNLDSSARFPALQNGEVDMLSRNTTWTISRDSPGGNAFNFAPVTFYDGQGLLASRASGVQNLEGMNGKSVCVETGTTTELNLASRTKEAGITVSEVKFQDSNAGFAAFGEGRCEVITSDRSQLAAKKTGLQNPDNFVLLEDVLSKEPLAPVVNNGEIALYDILQWTVFGLFQAEEFGITQADVAQRVQDPNPDIQNFLGTTGELGSQLGVANDFMLKVITTVGNYGEIYERNVGSGSPLNIDRGLNNLWTNGGLMYSPPFR